MDIRAFGSVFGQTSVLPYGSGVNWQPAQGEFTFPTCRGLYLNATNPGANNVYVELSDNPRVFHEISVTAPCLVNLACTAISGGSVSSAVVLY